MGARADAPRRRPGGSRSAAGRWQRRRFRSAFLRHERQPVRRLVRGPLTRGAYLAATSGQPPWFSGRNAFSPGMMRRIL
ncbi:hypothetical protein G6F61_014619 [Rhizopus arrhizus]|nr:hypothetical protein G6F68_021551 [Rhizopus microsporus]KAG1356030.1 hypothetical protein G6F61_014619 [Rhizopus arrhizus]